MNIETKKSEIIERFRHVEDEALIDTIRSLLDYASKKEIDNQEIPEEHKNIVRERIRKYGNNPKNYSEWNDIDNKLNTGQ